MKKQDARTNLIASLAEQLALAHFMGYEAPELSHALQRMHSEQQAFDGADRSGQGTMH